MPDGIEGNNWWKLLGQVFPPARPFIEGWEMPWAQPTRAAPAPPPQLAPRTYEAMARMTPEARARLPQPIPPEPLAQQLAREERERKEAQKALEEVGVGAPGFETHAKAFASLPNENWEVYKNEFGRFDIRRKAAPPPMPTGLTPAQQAAQDLAERQWEQQQAQWEWEQQQAGQISPYQQQQFGLQQQQFTQQMAQQQAQQALGQQQFGLQEQQFAEQQAQQALGQQQFGLQEQQFAEQQAQFQQQLEFQQAQAQAATEEQERQYMSQLAAQPINWLQYAAYTGQPPVVQPWMQPLGFQETEGALPPGVEVGQPIPGFQGQAGQQGMQTFAGLPQLRTPSAQLQARWGPTAQAQFLGYRQARTGAAPEETQFRLGSQRAPTGSFRGFSRFR